MHFTDYFAIVERDLDILNPTSHDKLMLLAQYCGVRDGCRVLDIGSGKGYLLRAWALRWAIHGTGLEVNAAFVAQARERAACEGVSDRVAFIEGPALDYGLEPESFDVVTCIGAPFAIGSFDEVVVWMRRALKPTGVMAIGDVFLPEPLDAAALNEEGLDPGAYRDLSGVAAALEGQGLTLTGLIAASRDDWDRYASGSWRTARAWAAENPDHPDRPEVLRLVDESRAQYLRFTRRHLDWAMFVAQPSP